MAPDFIIVGAMKAGTSTLHAQLARQPGIFMSSPKEPNFFSDDDQYKRGTIWYQSLFESASTSDLCGESSTHYTKLPTYPNTIERMADLLPGIKLVYIIRDPIDRLISHYIHDWTENLLHDPIDQAVETFRPLIDYGRYSMQVRPYLEAFGPENVKVVFFERMRRDPAALLEEVAQHIGYSGRVRWYADIARENVSSKRLRKSSWRDVIVDAPILSDIRRYAVPRAAREWVKSLWQMKKRPGLSNETIVRLREIFDEDLAELGNWGGIALSCETFLEAALTPFSWGPNVPTQLPEFGRLGSAR